MVSDFFVMCLAVLGVLIGFVLPVMSPAGSFLLSSGVIVCAGGYMIARIEERRSERKAQERRDAASERRYLDGLAAAFSNQSADIKATVEFQYAKWHSDLERRDALLASGIPPSSPQVQSLTESARSSAVTIAGVIAMSGTGTVTVAGHAPEVIVSGSKASTFMPRVSSSGKPPA